jgi:polysaccharide biosynthesis transport protein
MLTEEPHGPDLRHYVRMLTRHKWLVVVLTVIVVGVTVATSLAQTPIYAARADVLLQDRSGESIFESGNGVYVDPARVLATEIQVLSSRPVRDLVEERIGNAPGISASGVGQSNLIQIKAESANPQRAADTANAYANAYIEFRRTQAVEGLLAAAQQIEAKIADLQQRVDALPPPTTARPGIPSDSQAADSERNSLIQQQAIFRQSLDRLQVDASLKSGGAQLVTPAVAPSVPVRPTPVRNALLALVVGLMLGGGLAVIKESLDDSIRVKADVERAVPGVPVIGLVPKVSGWKDRKKTILAAVDSPSSSAAEAYRSLRTSVQFLGFQEPLRVLQVTSAAAGEGKSTTLANLAVTLAGAGQRVVIIDADLRKPRINEFFGLDRTVGLTSVLLGESDLPSALQPVPALGRLHVLASGPIPPNPSEMLASPRMAQMLGALAEHADIVLIDCPPLLPVADARVLAQHVNGTLVVVRTEQTKAPQLRRAVELMSQVGAPLLGVVLNGTTDETGYGSYGYNYGYGYRLGPGPEARPGVGFGPAASTMPAPPPTPPSATAPPTPPYANGNGNGNGNGNAAQEYGDERRDDDRPRVAGT